MDFSKTSDLRFQRPRLMQDGDLVVVYERHDSLDHIYLKTGKIFQNKYGAFHHNDMIGKPFGTKIASKSTPGWMYALEPTPELWSSAVHVRLVSTS
jgi:tRNA (adenine57-N1/adenine58-N1)-methyltransferase catalytic subunit